MYVLLGLVALRFLSQLVNNKKIKKWGKKIFKKYGLTILAVFLLAVGVDLMGFQDSALYDQFIECAAILLVFWPVKALFFRSKNSDKEKNADEYDEEESKLDLPDSAEGRAKIVKKFDEKYCLNLKDNEVEKIVAGSFISTEWANEIVAMKKQYATESEWYNSYTDWLRAYLKAFNVQNVTSDFDYQKEICIANFDEVFKATDMENFSSVDECVKFVNNKFMTNFNETSYMIAYRFLEKNFKRHRLPAIGIVKTRSEIEDLAEKYNNMSDTENSNIENLNIKNSNTESFNKDAMTGLEGLVEKYDTDTSENMENKVGRMN